MKDETDRTMAPELRIAYENMQARAHATLEAKPDDKWSHEWDHVRVNGRKLTLSLYLFRLAEGLEEQFEYYDYRYFHRKTI